MDGKARMTLRLAECHFGLHGYLCLQYLRCASGRCSLSSLDMGPVNLLYFALFAATCSLLAQQAGTPTAQPSAQQANYLQKASKMQMAWGAPMSTPGSTLELRETGRKRTEDKTVVTYRIYGHGLPTNQTYTLVRWPLNGQPEVVLSGVTLGQDAMAICSGAGPQFCGDSATPNDPVDLKTFGGKGEPFRIALEAEDHKDLAAASVAPFPVTAENKGCSLESILVTANAEAILLQGSGFVPNASVEFIADSSGEKHALTETADSSGHLNFIVLPYNQGRDDGSITLQPTTGPCRPSLAVPWGKHSYKLQ